MPFTLVALTVTALGGLLGATLVSLRTRFRFARAPGSFGCKVRALGEPRLAGTRFRQCWGRRRTAAVWAHDVLLVRCGLFGQQVVALPVRLPEHGPRPAPDLVRGLGSDPQVLGLRLDGGSVVELAIAAEARVAAVGPFLAAAIPGLPAAPADRPPRRR
jgi:hypothetical protein